MRPKDKHFGLATYAILMFLATPCYSEEELDRSITSFVEQHCASCHGSETASGGLDLQVLGTDLNDPDRLIRWVRIYDRVSLGEMPPKTERQPDKAALLAFRRNLSQTLNRADARQRRTVLRRLNRVEYEHTVCDLFGIRVALKDLLPEDPSAYGFDTVGEALAISPEQMELYLQAADQAVLQVFGADREPPRVDIRMPLGRDPFVIQQIDKLFLANDDDSITTFQDYWCPTVFHAGKVKTDGTYRVRIQAKAFQTTKPLVMSVYGGDVIVERAGMHLVGYFDVAPGDEWTTVTFEDFIEKEGCYLMKPYGIMAPTQGPDRFKGAGLRIGEVSVEGPLEAWPPPSRKSLLGNASLQTGNANDAREILTRLLPRAFRRRINAGEVEPYFALTKAVLESRRSFQEALGIGLKAILCSPEFLMREEPSLKKNASGRSTISDEALASRISYFLWSSMPDDELLALAAEERLSQPDVLRGQVDRMLRDPKSNRFVENFTGQWLGLRNILFTEPDAKLYPEFDEMLRYAMVEETRRFFREILDRDLPITDFVDSDWTILNERLAVHYGIKGVKGQDFRRISLPANSVRGGVMTQASVLKVTANGTTTSPVVRGAWVLNNILGRPTPPPPANVPPIEPDIRGAATIREQLEKHRSIESCAACHNRIDPPGMALESFDPIGGWRRQYRSLSVGAPVNLEIRLKKVEYRTGRAVKANAQMPDGRPIGDIRDFKKMVLEDKNSVARCLAEKLLVYAVGRGFGFSDRVAVQEIVAKNKQRNYGFRSLVQEVILSSLFLQK